MKFYSILDVVFTLVHNMTLLLFFLILIAVNYTNIIKRNYGIFYL
jgi:hypothetical protein